MAPTEGRVAKPEQRWDCRRGTPICYRELHGIMRVAYKQDTTLQTTG